MKKNILYTTILAAASMVTQAQTTVQNTGILHVSTGSDIVYINGALTNAVGATLTNNGDLYVLQNLTNNQVSMAVGTGRLWLTGSALQVVGGAQPFRTFNFNTNNAAGFTLNSNLHVSGAHTYVAGVLTTSATPNYLIYESGSSHTGSSHAAHVNGWVRKLGNTGFTFPVGTATVSRPVTVGGLSSVSEYNVRHNITTPSTLSFAVPLQQINPNEYWTVNRATGTGTAQITMNWNHPSLAFFQHYVIDYRAVYLNAGTWINLGGSASGTPTTTGTITSSAISVFGNFGFGSVNAEILPVDFLSVWGYARTGYNMVEWKTDNEANIAHFDIQRSVDGSNFIKIGEQAANNTPGIHAYEFKDAGITTAAWYRIRNVDLDGNAQFSSVIRIAPAGNTTGLRLVNTLVSDKIILSASDTDKGEYQYMLVNAGGQTMQQGKFMINGAGITQLSLNGHITGGTYMLYLYSNKHQSVEKVVVK